MNRHEIKRQRRELERKNKKYTLTVREIENIKNTAVTDAVNLAFPLVCGIAGIVVRDKWGFGPVRMKRFMAQMLSSYEDFAIGNCSIEDDLQAIKEETGYDIIEMIAQIDKKAEMICRKSKELKFI